MPMGFSMVGVVAEEGAAKGQDHRVRDPMGTSVKWLLPVVVLGTAIMLVLWLLGMS
jgi:hypothetical protein